MRALKFNLLACLLLLPLQSAVCQDTQLPIHSVVFKQEATGWKIWIQHELLHPGQGPYTISLPPGVSALPDNWAVTPQAGWSYAIETDNSQVATLATLQNPSEPLVSVGLGDQQIRGNLVLLSDKQLVIREYLPGIERLHTLDPKKVSTIDILQPANQSRRRVKFHRARIADEQPADEILQVGYSIAISAPNFVYELAVDGTQSSLSGAASISNPSGQDWSPDTSIVIENAGMQFTIKPDQSLASGSSRTIPYLVQGIDTHWQWSYSAEGLSGGPQLVATEPALLQGYPPGQVCVQFVEIPQTYFTAGVFSEESSFALAAPAAFGFRSKATATSCESVPAVDVIGVWLYRYDLTAREIAVSAGYSGGRPVRFVKSAADTHNVRLTVGERIIADNFEYRLSESEMQLKLQAYPRQLPSPIDFRRLQPAQILSLNLSTVSGPALQRLTAMQRDVMQLEGWLAERSKLQEQLNYASLNQRLLALRGPAAVVDLQQSIAELDKKIAARYVQFQRAAGMRPTRSEVTTRGCVDPLAAESTSASSVDPQSRNLPAAAESVTTEDLPVPRPQSDDPQTR